MSPAAARALGNTTAFHAIFFEEADEHLAAIEQVLLGIDPASPAAEDLNAIFRAVHSIKGTAGMFGYAEIVTLTHVLENLLDILRKRAGTFLDPLLVGNFQRLAAAATDPPIAR